MTQRTLLQAERDRLRGSTLEVLRERPAKALRAYHDVCKEILLKFIPELGTGTSVLQSGVWTTPFIRMVGELPDSQIGFVDLMLRTSIEEPECLHPLVYFSTKPYRDCVINIMERRRALSKPLHSPIRNGVGGGNHRYC